jgi:hypothetical protein
LSPNFEVFSAESLWARDFLTIVPIHMTDSNHLDKRDSIKDALMTMYALSESIKKNFFYRQVTTQEEEEDHDKADNQDCYGIR